MSHREAGDSPFGPARAAPSHQDLYPEQYSDPLCGLRVTVAHATDDAGKPIAGTVERVVSSRFGRLAILSEYGPRHAWLASDCQPVDCYTLNGIEVTLAEFLDANADLEPEERRAVHELQPGEEIPFGGGAGVLFVLRRELPGWPGRLGVEEAGHGLFVVRTAARSPTAGPFADRATAEWNARMQGRHWWRCPGTALWFATDEASTAWMCPSVEYPAPADRPDFTAVTLATDEAVRQLACRPGRIRTAFRQEYGRDLPPDAMRAGWVACPLLGWYARGDGGQLDVAPAAEEADRPVDAAHAIPLSAVAPWESPLRGAFAAWVLATFGVSMAEPAATPATRGWPVHEVLARLAASRVLAGTVGGRIPDREDRAGGRMVFAYLPAGAPAEHGEIDAVVVEPAEGDEPGTLDVCVGTGMSEERLTVRIADLAFGGRIP